MAPAQPKGVTKCPACQADVIAGSDFCEECGMDLHHFEVEEESDCKIRRSVMEDRLSALEPPAPITLAPTASIAEAIGKMVERRHGAVCVVDENGVMIGIFTERDALMRVAGKEIDLDSTPVSEVMTDDPLMLKADITLAFAMNQMAVAGLRHLPLLDEEGRPVGITTVRGVMNYIAENALSG